MVTGQCNNIAWKKWCLEIERSFSWFTKDGESHSFVYTHTQNFNRTQSRALLSCRTSFWHKSVFQRERGSIFSSRWTHEASQCPLRSVITAPPVCSLTFHLLSLLHSLRRFDQIVMIMIYYHHWMMNYCLALVHWATKGQVQSQTKTYRSEKTKQILIYQKLEPVTWIN